MYIQIIRNISKWFETSYVIRDVNKYGLKSVASYTCNIYARSVSETIKDTNH